MSATRTVLGNPAQALHCTRGLAKAMSVDLSELLHTGGLLPQDYAKMITRCRGCANPAACEAWVAEGGSQPPAFCENAELFGQFARVFAAE